MATNDTIFKLNTVDYSEHVVAEEYKVNLKPIYQEWTDGAQVKHRDIVAQKLQGTFKLFFNTAAELQTFVSAMAAAKTSDNTYPVQLKANNNAIASLRASTNVFLDFEPVRKRNGKWEDVFDVIEVTVEEP